jgi:dimeric dUTPase (all-alpha-NTP-PPase superfamily)
MNLEQLYEMQKALDARIIKEKGLEGQDLLPNTVLALQVEIAELANEWRGFKLWSNDRAPRREVKCHACRGRGYFEFGTDAEKEPCTYCEGTGVQEKDPLLEEYVDCLHFFLSIARQLDIAADEMPSMWEVPHEDTTTIFINLITAIGLIDIDQEAFDDAWTAFNQLSTRLNLTWEQIAEAYLAKNKVNHERQTNGY